MVVSDDDVKTEYENRNVKAKIAYVLAPPSTAPVAAIPDAGAEAAFKSNPAPYMQPEKRKAKYLLVETARLRPTIVVSDADVQADYSANQESYRKGEEVHARHILYKVEGGNDASQKARAEAAVRKLRGGADFAALAKAESDDPGSKAQRGRPRLVPEGPDGQGVRGGRLRREGEGDRRARQELLRLPRDPGPREDGRARPALLRGRPGDPPAPPGGPGPRGGQASRGRALGEGPKLGKASDDDLRKLASAGVTFNETDFLARTDAPAGIGFNPQFIEKLFSLKEGETSPASVATARGEAIVKCVEVKKPGLPTFAEVKARVVADLQKKKQDEATLASVKEALESAGSLEALAKKLNLKVETPEAFPKAGPIPGLGAPKARARRRVRREGRRDPGARRLSRRAARSSSASKA